MSSFIKLHHVYFSFANNKTELFSNISIAFHEGWTSICGVNGCGKSTLLNLITGHLKVTSGQIEKQGNVYHIPQETEQVPINLNNFRTDFSKKALRLRVDLGILDDQFDRWGSLSIGERKRIQVAIALSKNPDILLIDEPTNHLDEETKYKILCELKAFRGIGVLISHDRLLLNNLCQSTVFMKEATCISIHAPYDSANKELIQNQQSTSDSYDQKKDLITRMKSRVQNQSEKVAQGSKKLSKRALNPKDHDTKAKIDLARLTGADASDSRKKRILEQKCEKMSKELSQLKIKKNYKLGVFFGEIKNKKHLYLPQNIWSTSFLKIHIPEISVESGEHIAITGANGSGKSTFFNLWLENIEGSSLNVGVAKQEMTSAEKAKLMEELSKMDTDLKGKVFTLISCFGSDPKSISEGSLASPGVWQKIVIAKAIVEGCPILFLDEPTNHMDIAAIQILEEALKLYEGTLVLISHDRNFVNNICNRELVYTKENKEITVDLKYISKIGSSKF